MSFWEDRVLFIDGEAIVIDKPAGLAVHPGTRTRESLEDYLHHLRFGFQRLPLPVHRLDRDTSGCLLLARNPKAHKAFQRAFEDKRVEQDLCRGAGRRAGGGERHGRPGARQDVDRRGGLADGAGRTRQAGGDALARRGGAGTGAPSWSSRPETGRTHQIRVHAAAGHRHPDRRRPGLWRGEGADAAPRFVAARRARGKPPVEATAPLPPTFVSAGFGGIDLAAVDAFEIPEEALSETFLAASGPGGQNVNKVATAVPAALRRLRLGLAPDVYRG